MILSAFLFAERSGILRSHDRGQPLPLTRAFNLSEPSIPQSFLLTPSPLL
jgi:hypothetical protein